MKSENKTIRMFLDKNISNPEDQADWKWDTELCCLLGERTLNNSASILYGKYYGLIEMEEFSDKSRIMYRRANSKKVG